MRICAIEEGRFPDLFVAYLASPCYHCESPACVTVCPAKAITKREVDGIVVVDSEKCLGNENCPTACLNACPWDAPQFGPEENAKMQKCDFCVERLENGQQPICVASCPMYALDVGPLTEFRAKYGAFSEAAGFRYSEKLGPSAAFKPKKRGQDEP
jgi:anaerobic dimethyl sulfoxide reductase subunit B (iron-sulfur subunit)